MRRRTPWLVLLVAAGCSTVETQSFNVSRGGNVESAQIAVDADFSRYDRLQAEEMGIYFPAGVAMPGADLQRLRQSFREAFLAKLEGYSLIDLRGSAGTDISGLRRDVRDIAKAGSLVFLMEMRDSTSGRVLARAADSAKAPALGTSAGADTDWTAVEDAAAHWAQLFRQFLDENLGR